MQIPPLSNPPQQIGRQLAELDREIHDALKDIRRHLEELEAVSNESGTESSGRSFADVLKDSLENGDSSASESGT